MDQNKTCALLNTHGSLGINSEELTVDGVHEDRFKTKTDFFILLGYDKMNDFIGVRIFVNKAI